MGKQVEKAAAESTFRIVAEEVIAKLEREGRAHVTITKKRWLLAFAFAFAFFGAHASAASTAGHHGVVPLPTITIGLQPVAPAQGEKQMA